jgi:1A family penicillin-binding protein
MKKFKKFILVILILFLFFILALIGLYVGASFMKKLPIESANGFYMYDKDNTLFNKTDNWTSLDDISPYLINATLSIEDKRFYSHKGFDFLRIGKAMFNNILSGSNKEGASTISQQYAKNLFLTFDKTWKRKIVEAWYTIQLETHYSKDEILEGYLNTINYGGVYGIRDASLYYFGKEPSELTLAEASILAGIPKSPSNYSPIKNEENAKERQELILASMVSNGYISQNEMDLAKEVELSYVGSLDHLESSTIMYYEDAVLNELKNISTIPSSLVDSGGLKIYTTLDMEAQSILENSMNENLKKNETIQIASVMMDSNNGNILAILGGRDYSKSEFNRVTSSYRQVGSTIKPFLYYTALENGFTASTTFTSEKTVFTFSNNKTYSPTNYADLYANKNISMAAAIAYSDNIFAVKTHLFLGEETLVEFASRLGISSSLEAVPSLALGTNEINILNMMQGYGTFASEGKKVIPHFILKVEDMYGNTLYEFEEEEEVILSKNNVYILNEMLKNCYNKNFVDYTYPTCSSIASKITKSYAIKTGTTTTDNWIFGYNKDIVLGTWLGYDDNSETDNADSLMMKNFWVDSMEAYLKEKEDNWYETPNNVVGVLVDPISGEVANESTKNPTLFYYIRGTQPTEESREDVISTMKEQ